MAGVLGLRNGAGDKRPRIFARTGRRRGIRAIPAPGFWTYTFPGLAKHSNSAKTSRGRRLLLAGVIALVALPCALGGAALWVRHEVAGGMFRHPADLPVRDVGIVLGASVYRSGRPSPVVESRLAAALELLRAGKIRRILVSGDHRPEIYDEADAMARWLLRAGVTPDHLALDRAGARTWDSMVRAAQVFDVKSAVVCTQAFHLPRATFLARRAGIDAVGLEVGAGLAGTSWHDLLRESFATVRALWDVHQRPRVLPRPPSGG
jgi:SanA protein